MGILTLVLVLLSAVIVRAQNRECETSELGYACKKQMTDYYALHWSLGPTTQGADADEGEIAIAMVGTTTGWVGIGFPEEAGTMAPADAVIGWVDGEDVVVNAYRPTKNFISRDELDDDFERIDVSAMESEGNTTVQFVRSLEGPTVSLSIEDRIPVNVAIGQSDRLRHHGFGPDRRQSLFIELGAARREETSGETPRRMSSAESNAPPEPSPVMAPAPLDGDVPVEAPTANQVNPNQRQGCVPSDLGYDCMMRVSLVLTMHWMVGPADETDDVPEISEGEIAMALVGQTTGWVGISFAETPGSMFPADAVIGWVDGSDVTVESYRITERAVTVDNQNDDIGIRDVSGSEEDDVTTISFVWTGDFTFDVDLSGTVNMNWAVGMDDALTNHRMYRGSFAVDLSPLPESAEEPGMAEEPDAAEEPGMAEEPDAAEEPGMAEELENFEEEMGTMLREDRDSDCPPSDLDYRCMTDQGNPVFVHWTLGPSRANGDVPEVMEGEVAIAMVAETVGWVGISFAEESGEMAPADAILGWVIGTEATVTAYRITIRNISPDDASTDIGIRETSGSQIDGTTTIRFIANGTFTFDVDFAKTINMNWAVGSDDSLVQHNRRGSFAIRF